jgi:hypothetical protein
MPGSGAEYYARGDIETLAGRDALFDFLARDQRVCAMGPRTDLCAIHQASTTRGFEYQVLDTTHAKLMLLSNRLPDGWETDDNPLKTSIVREPPTDIRFPLSVNFDDEIELIGATYPARVDRGSSFELVLYYKVLAKPKRNWQIFVHFDGGGHRPFQGDHWPLDNTCGTSYWQPGDYVIDRFEVTAGDVATAKREYQLWAGFFVGSSGNWTNMTVKSAEKDDNNRAPIGTIIVQ